MIFAGSKLPLKMDLVVGSYIRMTGIKLYDAQLNVSVKLKDKLYLYQWICLLHLSKTHILEMGNYTHLFFVLLH